MILDSNKSPYEVANSREMFGRIIGVEMIEAVLEVRNSPKRLSTRSFKPSTLVCGFSISTSLDMT